MPTELSHSKYRILSLIEEPNFPPTGITDRGLDPAPVYLNGADQIWTITPLPTQGLRFSIGQFLYTGVDKEDKNIVIATLDRDKNVTWFATPVEGYEDVFIITEDLERTKGWTVFGVNAPGLPIVVERIQGTATDPPRYLPYQLFKIERVPEE